MGWTVNYRKAHERLVRTALHAIEEVFSDTSVEQFDTRDSLESLAADIDMKLQCLREDLRRNGQP